MQHPEDKSHIWASLSVGPLFNSLSLSIYSGTSLPCSRWHCGKQQHDYNYDVHVCVCLSLCMCVCVHLFACVCLVWLRSDTWCGCVVPPISAPSLPPLSFHRKLIGGCHWCVKLLCVGRCRQLDYLFFIFSILELLPSALLLFFKWDLVSQCSV